MDKRVIPSVSIALACASAASLPAQGGGTGIVVPAEYAASEATGTAFWALGPFRARRQLLIDQRHVPGPQAHTLRGLSLRRNAADPRPQMASRVHLEIALSISPRNADAPSHRFADNRGPVPVTVFRGEVGLPASLEPPPVPAPWSGQHAVSIPFDTPFVYAGGTLCIEVVTDLVRDPGTGQVELPWWPIDALVQGFGGRAIAYGASCASDLATGAAPGGLAVGGSAVLFVRGDEDDDHTAVCAVGVSDRWMQNQPLPIDLTPLGAPSCWLLTDSVSLIPARFQRLTTHEDIGRADVTLPIPFDRDLAGRHLFAQWIVPDSDANALGLAFTDGVRAELGARLPDLGVGWIESADVAASTGRIYPGRCPVLRLWM